MTPKMKSHLFLLIFFGSLFTSIYAQDSINLLDTNGKFHGKYRKLYDNGNLRYEGQFDHGKEIGIFKFYAITGEKNPIVIKEFSPNTDSVNVKFYALSGKLESEGKMLNKSREGLWKYYFPDGKTLMSTENYKKDLLDGETRIYYKNGKLTEVSQYKNGKLEGNRKRYDEDGKIVEDLHFANGTMHGPAIIYDENGALYAKGQYENGLKTGEWEFMIDGNWIKTSNPENFINNK